MIKHGKKWGTTFLVFKNEFIKICFIDIKKGGYSSKHSHKVWTNHFSVISGRLKIYQWTDEGFQDETTLNPGESTFIPEGIKHKFEALTNVQCIEVYTPPKVSDEDIDRDDTGGLIK